MTSLTTVVSKDEGAGLSDLSAVIPMGSARTECPECDGPDVVDLADLLYSPTVDYFRCRVCGCWWMVPKGADEPATRVILGNPNSVISLQVS
jgi:hypothetical protein